MNFRQPNAVLFIPDGTSSADTLARTTHLGIGAHQDDLEFMAFHGIIACYESDTRWFTGVTCTDGAGSPRAGAFSGYDDAVMRAVRRDEQNLAAQIGRYGAMIQLDHPSSAVKGPHNQALQDDLRAILRATRPQVVYTHNLADKHATHVAVAVATLQAIRDLPDEHRPSAVYGCEVWRDLDWLPDGEKIVHDLSDHDDLAARLNAVFASQIAGGKRYDLAVAGRRRAHATFHTSHAVDDSTSRAFAMDLTPLVQAPTLDIATFLDTLIEKFRWEVHTHLSCPCES